MPRSTPGFLYSAGDLARLLHAATAGIEARSKLVPLVPLDGEPSVQPAASRSRETSRGWRSRGGILDVSMRPSPAKLTMPSVSDFNLWGAGAKEPPQRPERSQSVPINRSEGLSRLRVVGELDDGAASSSYMHNYSSSSRCIISTTGDQPGSYRQASCLQVPSSCVDQAAGHRLLMMPKPTAVLPTRDGKQPVPEPANAQQLKGSGGTTM
ncbi:hypothetical protein TgHK011_006511 [Trichoderma gracile]|nr:hypothetical protein TgHK011_006511 [Trichoderma gracile]